MSMGEQEWRERAQSAEAKLSTCQSNQDRIKEKFRDMMSMLGARERSDGSVDIDFDALVRKLSVEHALELRRAIDEYHRISGDAGEKPRIRLVGATA